MKRVITLLLLILFFSCTRRTHYFAPIPADLKQDNVSNILFKGKIHIKSPKDSMDGSIFVIAQKKPFNIRMEISNWLSGPLFYIFIKKSKVYIISLKERKVYIGSMENINRLYNIFPPGLNKDQIWAILRGIPYNFSKKLSITYSDYHSFNGIAFAKKINIYSFSTQTLWELNIKEIQFNRSIPEEVFKIKVPDNFEIFRYQVPSS